MSWLDSEGSEGWRCNGAEGVTGTTTLVDLVKTRVLTFRTTSIRVTTSFLLKGMFSRIPTDTRRAAFLDLLAGLSRLRFCADSMDRGHTAGCKVVGRGGEDSAVERKIEHGGREESVVTIRPITTPRVLRACTLDLQHRVPDRIDSLILSELQQTFAGKHEFFLRIDDMHG